MKLPNKINLVAGLAMAALLLAYPPASQPHGTDDYVNLFEDTRKSVVSVNSVTLLDGNPQLPFFFPFDQQNPNRQFRSRGFGSGVIIGADGYILTNAHVILNQGGEVVDNVEIVLHTKKKYTAEVLGFDTFSDIALLKIDPEEPLPVASIGNSDLAQVGQSVVAIGHPLGLDYTLTSGIISSLNRSIGGGSERFVPFIQTDAAINPGNSGGPLLNSQGEVIGINARIIGNSGGFIGYSLAIPINLAMGVQAKLRDDGKIRRGMLGVTFSIQGISEDDAKVWKLDPSRGGVLINSVIEGTGAAEAGIQAGDIVLEYNGNPIIDPSDFPRFIANTEPGEKVTVTLFRGGEEMVVEVTIGAIDDGGLLAAIGDETAPSKPLGMVLEAVPEQTLQDLGIDGGARLVDFDNEGGEIEIAQELYKLRPGDIIIGVIISGKLSEVSAPADLRRLLADLQTDTVGFQIKRQRQRPFFVTINLSR